SSCWKSCLVRSPIAFQERTCGALQSSPRLSYGRKNCKTCKRRKPFPRTHPRNSRLKSKSRKHRRKFGNLEADSCGQSVEEPGERSSQLRCIRKQESSPFAFQFSTLFTTPKVP